MNTHTLFDSPPSNGTATSARAAEKVAPHTQTQRERIVEVIKGSRAGITREGVIASTGCKENTCNPRIRELVEAGLVEDRDTGGPRKVLFWKGNP